MTLQIESVWHAEVQQCIFREILECFSRPGELRDLSKIVKDVYALRLVLATLLDAEVSLADPFELVAPTDWSLLEAQKSDVNKADFVIANGAIPPSFQPKKGTLESPERGCTVLIKVERFETGDLILNLSGPGIEGKRSVQICGLHCDWLKYRADWVKDFPMGVDLVLISDSQIMALPRTTSIDWKEMS